MRSWLTKTWYISNIKAADILIIAALVTKARIEAFVVNYSTVLHYCRHTATSESSFKTRSTCSEVAQVLRTVQDTTANNKMCSLKV